MAKNNTTSSVIEALSKTSCFQGLGAGTLQAIAQSAIDRRYKADETIFLEGDPCAGFYIVQEGWLKSVKVSPAGREQVVRARMVCWQRKLFSRYPSDVFVRSTVLLRRREKYHPKSVTALAYASWAVLGSDPATL